MLARRLLGLSILLAALMLTACDGVQTDRVALMTVPGAPAQNIAVTTKDNYYDINGNTPTELAAQMERLGPTDGTLNGRRYNAWTGWYVKWSYAYNGVTNGCQIGTVKVELSVNYTWPRWNRPGNVSAELGTKWDKFLVALHTHESGHRENGIRAAQEVYRGLSAMPPAPNCDFLQQAATNIGNHLLDGYRQQDVQYDQTTRHGATQGVVFP